MFNKVSYMWKLDVSKNLLQEKTYGQIATVKVRWQVNENGGSISEIFKSETFLLLTKI